MRSGREAGQGLRERRRDMYSLVEGMDHCHRQVRYERALSLGLRVGWGLKKRTKGGEGERDRGVRIVAMITLSLGAGNRWTYLRRRVQDPQRRIRSTICYRQEERSVDQPLIQYSNRSRSLHKEFSLLPFIIVERSRTTASHLLLLSAYSNILRLGWRDPVVGDLGGRRRCLEH